MRSYSKYRARPVVLDGIRFASRREEKRYRELCLLNKSGDISRLELQPKFSICIHGQEVAVYIADFRYVDKKGARIVIEDVKGFKTPVYKLKKKLVEAIYGIVIVEV